MALVRTDVTGMLRPDTPGGYGPSDIQTAYALTSYSATRGSGVTVAVVDAYDDPNAESDLAVYRAQYGLPACTSSSGCFTKMAFSQAPNRDWASEESLDLDMVSAICPNCNILLVEAAMDYPTYFRTAEKYAIAHAKYVSNSWGGGENGFTRTFARVFNAPGVAITASTGDYGYKKAASWPAILPAVTAVGGTTMTSVDPRLESAWHGSGSGCSRIFPAPHYQQSLNTGCTKRAEADVAAVADPNTGVAVYDSYEMRGWRVFGGTSVASPIVASVFALAGEATSNNNAYVYAHAADLNNVTTGENGHCGPPLCWAGIGWNGPTGLGSPNGIGAF